MTASCEWPVDRTCLPAIPELTPPWTPDAAAAYELAVAQQSSAEDLAVSVLWALSGRQFGVCETTVRPCPTGYDHARSSWAGPQLVVWDETGWRDTSCGCLGRCTQSGPSMVHLPGPVAPTCDAHPITVTIAGAILDPAEYVIEGNILYRRAGKSWPGQNLAAPNGEPGTWSVTYRRGTPVPPGVDTLTGLLAKEFLNACSGGKCRLPRNVRSISRQGVAFEVYDSRDMYASGKTGLAEVDLWLTAVNPNHLAAAPEVL